MPFMMKKDCMQRGCVYKQNTIVDVGIAEREKVGKQGMPDRFISFF